MKNKKLIGAGLGFLGLSLVLTYTNCSQTADDPAQVSTPAPPAFASHICGGATFVSDTYTVDTSINGQNGWFADPASNFSEAILNVGTDACRGHGVWKISNAVVSSAFGNQPISPAFTKANGESTVKSIGGGDSMSYSFFFRTKSTQADGSTMTLSLSPTTADRHDYLRFENNLDGNNGLQIYAFDGATFTQHNVALNITRGLWHHVALVNTNPDGGGNDVVKVYLDGMLVSTHTTWEDWRTALPAVTLAVTRVLFRLSVTSASVDASFTSPPEGFYIDDFIQSSFKSSQPDTIIESYATGFEN
jgi:hypothetical protein